MSGPLAYCWYDATAAAAMTALTLGFSLRVEGGAHAPRTGPLLVLANHQSFLDPLLVGVAVPRHMASLARKTLFHNPALAWFIRSVGAIPIDHEGVGKEGLRAVLEELDRGNAVLVYPEGTRSRDGKPQPLKPGVHLLLSRAKAPVLPVGIAGAYDAWPGWRKYPVPDPLFLPCAGRSVAVSVGVPVDAGRFAGVPRDQALGEIQEEIRKAVARAERLRRKP